MSRRDGGITVYPRCESGKCKDCDCHLTRIRLNNAFEDFFPSLHECTIDRGLLLRIAENFKNRVIVDNAKYFLLTLQQRCMVTIVQRCKLEKRELQLRLGEILPKSICEAVVKYYWGTFIRRNIEFKDLGLRALSRDHLLIPRFICEHMGKEVIVDRRCGRCGKHKWEGK